MRTDRPEPGVPDPVGSPVPDGGRHCWVLDAADREGLKRPGLLLEWRRDAGGVWEGRVVYAARVRAGSWCSVEEWLPAALLEPA